MVLRSADSKMDRLELVYRACVQKAMHVDKCQTSSGVEWWKNISLPDLNKPLGMLKVHILHYQKMPGHKLPKLTFTQNNSMKKYRKMCRKCCIWNISNLYIGDFRWGYNIRGNGDITAIKTAWIRITYNIKNYHHCNFKQEEIHILAIFGFRFQLNNRFRNT